MAKVTFTYVENPNTGVPVRVYHDQIEGMAFEDGIDTLAEDMDDDTFYKYANRVMEGD